MKHFLFIICLFLIASCNRNTFDDPNANPGEFTGDILTGNFYTPTFDYMMGGSVELDIQDVSGDAIYTVYSFSDDNTEEADVEVTDPETGEVLMFEVEMPKSNSWAELGTVESQGNGVKLSLDVPTDIEKLIIRKMEGTEVSFQEVELAVGRPLTRSVAFEAHTKSMLKSAQADDFSVLWGLNAKENLFTIDLSKDVSDLKDQLDAIPLNEGVKGDGDPVYGPEFGESYMNLLAGLGAFTLKDAEPHDESRMLLEDGSWTIAMDDGNNGFYSIGKDKALHKGQQLYPVYYYPLTNMEDGNGEVALEGHSIVGWMPFTAPRLEFAEGFLYVSTNRKIIQMVPPRDPDDEMFFLDQVAISELDNNQGGDIVQTDPASDDEPKRWFMTTFGGLYELGWDPNLGAIADRKSASTLPFAPTSIAYSKFHYPGDIWMADYFDKSAIYAMDPEYGSYQRMYHLPIKCNDLTCANGASDYEFEDQFPADERYYQVDFPSKYGYGSIVFEDMYPLMQDYDFNDLVMDFRYEVYYTKEVKVYGIKLQFVVRNVSGANFNNGFGFSFDGVPASWIENTFYSNSKANGLFQRDHNGVESGLTADEDAVFMVFDNQHDYRVGDKEIEVYIIFSDQAESADFYNGFNPFIFVDGRRELEVHCPDKAITSKADLDAFHEFHDITWTEDLDYHDPNSDPALTPNVDDDFRGYQHIGDNYYYGFPWVLVLPHSFQYPKEEAPITAAYPKFKHWANLNQTIDDIDPEAGSEERYEDWYSDKYGYQAHEYIDFD